MADSLKINPVTGLPDLVGTSGGGGGTVTSVDTGVGLTGGPITTSGTIDLEFPILAPDGSVGAPSYSFASDPNTGIFLLAPDVLSLAIGGSNKVAISTTDLNFTSLSTNYLAGASVAKFWNTGGTFSATLRGNAAQTANTTFQLPIDNGTSGFVLSTNGAGVTSWISNGANTTLSNLGITSINSSLFPSANNSFDIGAAALNWSNLHLTGTINLRNGSSLNLNIAGSLIAKPSGGSAPGLVNVSTSATPSFRNLNISSSDGLAADAIATGSLFIESGNKTAGTGNSGLINLQTGSSSGGASGDINLQTGTASTTRGKIILNSSSIEPRASFIPDVDFAYDVGTVTNKFNEVYAYQVNPAGLQILDWDGDSEEVGRLFINTDFNGQTPNLTLKTTRATDSFSSGPALAIGTSGNFGGDILIASADRAVNLNSGSLVIISGSTSGTGSTGGVAMLSADAAGSGNSGDVEIYSGASNSGNSGRIAIETNDSTSGNSGEIQFRTGSAPGGTRGEITLDTPAIRPRVDNGASFGTPDEKISEVFTWGTNSYNFTSRDWDAGPSGAQIANMAPGSGAQLNGIQGSFEILATGTPDGQSPGYGLVLGTKDQAANNIYIASSNKTGANTSGDLELTTGSTVNATSGGMYLYTGNASGSGGTGPLSFDTGAGDGNTGYINFTTGASTSGDSGNFSIQTGTAGGTRGSINLDGRVINILPSAEGFTADTAHSSTFWGSPVSGFLNTNDNFNSSSAMVFGSKDESSATANTPFVLIQTGSSTNASATSEFTGGVYIVGGSTSSTTSSGGTGEMFFASGNSASENGSSGDVDIATGSSGSSVNDSGTIRITSGNNTNGGGTGRIILKTGTGGGTRGYIQFDALVAVMPTGTSNPSTSYPNGSTYYNTSDNTLRILNGGTWRSVALT